MNPQWPWQYYPAPTYPGQSDPNTRASNAPKDCPGLSDGFPMPYRRPQYPLAPPFYFIGNTVSPSDQQFEVDGSGQTRTIRRPWWQNPPFFPTDLPTGFTRGTPAEASSADPYAYPPYLTPHFPCPWPYQGREALRQNSTPTKGVQVDGVMEQRPLSPEDFSSSPTQDNPAAGSNENSPTLSEKQLSALIYALEILKAAKIKLASYDEKERVEGAKKVRRLSIYLTGLFDGMPMAEQTPLPTGYAKLFDTTRENSIEYQVDSMIQLLEALSAAKTRGSVRHTAAVVLRTASGIAGSIAATYWVAGFLL